MFVLYATATTLKKTRQKLTNDLVPHVTYGRILVHILAARASIWTSSDINPHASHVAITSLVPPRPSGATSASRDNTGRGSKRIGVHCRGPAIYTWESDQVRTRRAGSLRGRKNESLIWLLKCPILSLFGGHRNSVDSYYHQGQLLISSPYT
jgi:hypothetical protein